MELLCRICEESVLQSNFKFHSDICLYLYQSEAVLNVEKRKLVKCKAVLLNVIKSGKCVEQLDTVQFFTRLMKAVEFAMNISLFQDSINQVTLLKNTCGEMEKFSEKYHFLMGAHATRIFAATKSVLSYFAAKLYDLYNSILSKAQSVGLSTFLFSFVNKSRDSSDPTTPVSGYKAEVSIEDFRIIKPISRGANGSVYLVQKKYTGDYYAIKVLKKKVLLLRKNLGFAQEEQDSMIQSDNHFVVKLYYTFHSEGNIYMVLEYHPGGDCFSLLRNSGSLTCNHAATYLADIILAVEYLHHIGIVHRDLKPDNFLISRDGHLKLVDFGLSSMCMFFKVCICISVRWNNGQAYNAIFFRI